MELVLCALYEDRAVSQGDGEASDVAVGEDILIFDVLRDYDLGFVDWRISRFVKTVLVFCQLIHLLEDFFVELVMTRK